MATLIQSKQIEGVVTASVIEGQFTVTSGSVDLAGASGVTGSFTGSFIGDGSQLTFLGTGIVSASEQINYNLVQNKPVFIAGSNVTIASSSNNITISSTDSVTSYTDLTNIPDGIVSQSSQVIALLPNNVFSGSFIGGSNVTITSGSGNITISSSGGGSVPAGTISSSAQIISSLPSGVVSGSTQITDGSGLVSGSVLRNLDGTGVISGSVLRTLDGTGVVSGSVLRTLDGTGVISGSSQLTSSYDSRYLQTTTYTSDSASFDTRIDGISASGSGADWNVNLQNIPSGLVSGSVLRTLDGTGVVSGSVLRNLDGTGVVSGSVLRTLDGTGVVSGSVLRTLDGTGVVSGSVLRNLDGTGVISGSVLRTLDSTNVVSSSAQVISLLPDGVVSASVQITDGSGIFSGSLIGGSNITVTSGSGNITIASSGESTPAGTISSSAQIIDSLPSGVVSGSAQSISHITSNDLDMGGNKVLFGNVYSTEGDLPNASTYHGMFAHVHGTGHGYFAHGGNWIKLQNYGGLISGSSQVTDGSGILSGSIVSQLPSGVVSGSSQITDGSGIVSGSVLRTLNGTGVVSGSVLRTLDSTGVFSGSLVAGSNITINQVGNNFEISSSASGGSASVTVSDSAPGSPSEGDLWWKSNDGNLYIYYDGYWVISTDITTGLPAGVVSGSAQITSVITDTYISASAASSGFGSGGSSDFTTLTNVPSGLVSGSSQLTSSYDTRYLNVNGDGVVSGSVLRTLDGTGVVSGSVLRNLDGTGVVSGSVLRTLDGTGVVSGSSQITDGSGIVSGSSQITDGSGLVSASSQIPSLLPDGVISGSSQLTSSYDTRYINSDGDGVLSGSILPGEGITINSGSGDYFISSSFNGNRLVSNTDLPSGIYNNNFGTSGSVQSFLEAVFFPNTAPSITTGNQTIAEFSASESQIATLVATDAEGQSLTFGTASSYTDDLVRVSSSGTMTLNALATSASFNTDTVGGGHGHLVTVTATDTFASVTEKDIYIIVTPNEAPKFRETSAAGNVITSVTANLNENSADDTLVKRVFFTDAESDTITITTSSIANDHFDVTIYSNYLDIRQNTASLDYETKTSYSFSITASDEHYPSPDSDSRTFLPVTINVTDNLAPTVNNQVVGSINENSSNGTVVGTVSVSDSEGDSVSAPSFELHKLLLDGSNVASSSYGGTSQLTDPHENPFEINSGNRQITRKNGVYLNSDLINAYQYRVKVKDNFNGLISSASVVTINITDDTAATLTDNWSAGPYIKESELSGTTIKTTDYGSTQADYNANQSGTWSSSNSAISINSNGNLSLNVNLSGSDTGSGDTIDSTITFTNTFGTTTTDALSVNVVANEAPTISFTNQTSNFNTNLATAGTTMVSMSVSDTEGDTPFSASLTGTDAASLQLKYVNSNSSSIGIQAASDLTAKTYNYNIRITDDFGKSRDYNSRSFTVATPDTGTLTGDTTSYIIESAESGALIREGTNGRTGNQADLDVSYSPNYGSQAVASFTSSISEIVVSNTGLLSLNVDISGSATSSGDTITPTITWRDQYDNVGSTSITINVAANQAPTATFTNQSANFETDNATTGTTMVSMSISDTESDTPFSASLTGTDASSLQLKYTNATSSSVGIQASTNLSAATYNYNVKVTDAFGKSTTYSGRSFTVTQSADYGKVFLYDVGYNNSGNNYNLALGISSENSDTPPVATPYTDSGFLDAIVNDNRLSNTSFSYSYGSTRTATLLDSGSGSNLHNVLRGLGSSGNISRSGTNAFVIIFPSGSDMSGIPTSTTDSYGGSNTGRYVLEVGTDGTSIDGTNTIEASELNQMTLATSHLGYSKWFMIGPANGISSTSTINLGLNAESGSGGV